jgi:hypothetical protein
MSYISKSKYFTIQGETIRIYSNRYGYYTHMLRTMLNQLFAMSSHHSKLFVMRIDLRQYENSPINKRITDFNRRLFDKIKTKYGDMRIGYAWRREQKKSCNPHYHYVLILDGHKVQHSHNLLLMAKSVWEHMDGSIWVPKNCFYNLTRNALDTLQKVIFRISYLAKSGSKNIHTESGKSYGTSKITWNPTYEGNNQ